MLCLMVFRLEIAFRGSIYEFSEKSIYISVFIISFIFFIFLVTSAMFWKGKESTVGDDVIQCNGDVPMVIAGEKHTFNLKRKKEKKGSCARAVRFFWMEHSIRATRP